ncbi:hypothetical protein, partial [Kingella kingae]|uniref:hypothetical protein n=1 Tax=Kingella kingae TaxID=504 RepID=UPI001FCAF904
MCQPITPFKEMGICDKIHPKAVNPIVTAQWEQKLAQMAKGQYSREQFKAVTESIVRDFVALCKATKCPMPIAA